jgi:hypothetical protein
LQSCTGFVDSYRFIPQRFKKADETKLKRGETKLFFDEMRAWISEGLRFMLFDRLFIGKARLK